MVERVKSQQQGLDTNLLFNDQLLLLILLLITKLTEKRMKNLKWSVAASNLKVNERDSV